MIIYLKQFEKIKNSKIKPNQELDVFCIGKDYINKMKYLNNYNVINNYIDNNNELQEIIIKNNNKSIGEISDLIIKKFDIKTIIKINAGKTKDKIENYDKQNNSQSVTINKGFDINFINNFYLLNKEMYILLEEGFYFKYIYFIGENKIFVPKVKQKVILVYNINDNNEINLELILCFDNSFDSFLRQIKENGFKKFKELNIFEKDEISPIFDTNNKKIGVAFKYFPYKNYYGGLKFCFGMRKMFILYLNYKKLEKEKNNSFDQYYIVNKRWIEKYKNYYDFDTIYKEIDKNCDMKSIINNLKEKDEGDIIISDKNLILMLKKLPKEMKKEFMEKDEFFSQKYKNTETKIPDISGYDYFLEKNQINTLFYYTNFEIINSKIYKYLFEKVDIDITIEKNIFYKKSIDNEEKKVYCSFDKNRIIIKLINDINNPNIKGILYIGQINSSFNFVIECFLLYNNISLMDEHIQKIIKSIGFNVF